MHLQTLLMREIDRFCGRESLMTELKKVLKHLSENDFHDIESLYIYLGCMFETKLDVAKDIVKYRDFVIRCAGILKRQPNIHDRPALMGVCKVLTIAIDWTAKIRYID